MSHSTFSLDIEDLTIIDVHIRPSVLAESYNAAPPSIKSGAN